MSAALDLDFSYSEHFSSLYVVKRLQNSKPKSTSKAADKSVRPTRGEGFYNLFASRRHSFGRPHLSFSKLHVGQKTGTIQRFREHEP